MTAEKSRPEIPAPHTPVKPGSRALWEERFRGNLDESGTGCSGVGLQYNRWLYRLRKQRFRQCVNGLLAEPEKSRVLDVGSGAGFYIKQWERLDIHELEGLDFSESAVRHLRASFPDHSFHLADITDPDLPLPSEHYDIVTAFDVMFHIVSDEDYRAALKNMRRILKPGGLLILSENFTHHEHARVSDYHYSRSLSMINHMMKSEGLQLCYRRPMFFLMNAPDDSRNRLLHGWWRMVRVTLRQGELAGWLAGAILYPLDRFLTSVMKEGPTTELAICRPQQRKVP